MSVLNDNNNAPAANIPANKQRQLLFEHTRTMHNSILSHLPTISDPVSVNDYLTHNKGLS
jgi:hypothetical protein